MKKPSRWFFAAAGLSGLAGVTGAVAAQEWTILGSIVACMACRASGVIVRSRRG